MNETDAIRIEEFRQFKKEILNPPPKVLYNSDYGPQRLAVGFYWTVSPDCGFGIDQNDRADINPQPGVGIALSH